MNNIVLPRNRILVQLFYAMFTTLKLNKKLLRPLHFFFLTKKILFFLYKYQVYKRMAIYMSSQSLKYKYKVNYRIWFHRHIISNLYFLYLIKGGKTENYEIRVVARAHCSL